MPHDQNSISVLIVDDNPRLIEDYASFLEQHHVTVYSALTGPEGIDQAKAHHPSVILLDLMLPELNGIETLRELKKDDTLKHIPTIVITALVEDQEKKESLAEGAFDYLAKVDLHPTQLLHCIKEAAEAHSHE